MKIEVKMPKMGESLQEGTITKWLKKPGDKIERDEMILEISTDKVDTEVPAPKAGTLSEIVAEEGETVEVGSVIAYLETEVGAAPSKDEPKKEEPKEEKQPEPEQEEEEPEEYEVEEVDSGDVIDIKMPKMGESLQEGTITKWLKKPGDEIERDEMILEISTDKVDTEVPAPKAGKLVEIIAEEGETVEVGSVIAKLSTGDATPVKKSAPKQPKKEAPKAAPKKEESAQKEIKYDKAKDTTDIPRKSGDKFFSPLVRSIAEKEGVTLNELDSIDGSGLEGRVTKDDVLNYIDKKKTAVDRPQPKPEVRKETKPEPKRETAPAKPQYSAPDVSGDDKEIIPMDRVRRLIAEHMTYSKRTSAHVTSVSEADVTGLVKYRNKHKDAFLKKEGIKLTFTPFFLQAAIDALREFPMVNVSVDMDEATIIRHKRINLGVATALPDGNLIVPVIKNAETLNLTGLARAVTDLATRARDKKLDPDEIQGGTFTLTNVGTFGTLFGTPIINQPQAAIMGIGALKKRPVVREIDGDDAIVIRHMAYVSITYDHRIIDGMLAGQCLAAIVKSLESMNEETLSF